MADPAGDDGGSAPWTIGTCHTSPKGSVAGGNGDLVESGLGRELIERVVHDAVRDRPRVALDEQGCPGHDLLHEVLVEIGPALDLGHPIDMGDAVIDAVVDVW